MRTPLFEERTNARIARGKTEHPNSTPESAQDWGEESQIFGPCKERLVPAEGGGTVVEGPVCWDAHVYRVADGGESFTIMQMQVGPRRSSPSSPGQMC